MKDLFNNKKPVQIMVDEWWFNGRVIQKQNDSRLPTWISFPDSIIQNPVEVHLNKKSAILFALKNPCLLPLNLPENYLG